MISPHNLTVRIVYVVGAISALALFNFSHMQTTKTEQQADFENWLGELEPKLQHPEITGTPFAPLHVDLDAPANGLHLSLVLAPTGDGTMSEHLARILQMAREARIFSLAQRSPGDVIFSVQSDKKKFRAALNLADVEQNSQAQAMIKLFEVYADTPPGDTNEKSK